MDFCIFISFYNTQILCEVSISLIRHSDLTIVVVFIPVKLYGSKESIKERHRHRYEVNPDYIKKLEANGLKFVGKRSIFYLYFT